MFRPRFVLPFLSALACSLSATRAHGQTFTSLTSFPNSSASEPTGDLTVSGSALYGTLAQGGANGIGGALFYFADYRRHAHDPGLDGRIESIRRVGRSDPDWLDPVWRSGRRRSERRGGRVQRSGGRWPGDVARLVPRQRVDGRGLRQLAHLGRFDALRNAVGRPDAELWLAVQHAAGRRHRDNDHDVWPNGQRAERSSDAEPRRHQILWFDRYLVGLQRRHRL